MRLAPPERGARSHAPWAAPGSRGLASRALASACYGWHVSDEATPSRAAADANDPARPGEVRSTLAAGEVVAGKYRLVRTIGRGGMGEVWMAEHVSLRTDLAVKFLSTGAVDASTRSHVLERFRFEAQVSAQLGLSTRGVVAVHDAGEHGDVPYLVMEYVPGHSLEDELERDGVLAPERVADVLDQVADALAVAHGKGIVHRDLKPSNLMVVDAPRDVGTASRAASSLTVKVADFGVAKAIRAGLSVDRPGETTDGYLVGSPSYMSPEQLRGGDAGASGEGGLDGRSDIWSLGVVAYEALTGYPPFSGRTMADLIVAISTRHPDPPSAVRATLGRAVDAWMDRALAKDPADRFGSVEEMAAAFRAAIVPSAQPSGRRALAPGVGGGVAGRVVAGAAGHARPRSGASASAAATATAFEPPSVRSATADGALLPGPPPLEAAPTSPRPVVEPAPPSEDRAPVDTAAPSLPAPRPRPPKAQATPPTAAPAETARRKKEMDPSEIQ